MSESDSEIELILALSSPSPCATCTNVGVGDKADARDGDSTTGCFSFGLKGGGGTDAVFIFREVGLRVDFNWRAGSTTTLLTKRLFSRVTSDLIEVSRGAFSNVRDGANFSEAAGGGLSGTSGIVFGLVDVEDGGFFNLSGCVD